VIFHVIAQVGAAPALLAATAAANAPPKIVSRYRRCRRNRRRQSRRTRTARAALLERGMAIAVIGRALLRVGQAGIGLVDLLELGLGFLAPRIAVGWNFIASLRNAFLMTLSSAVRSTSSNS
jgi:hypothetical protein